MQNKTAMTKHWKKNSDNNYSFFVNEKEEGNLEINFGSNERTATAKIKGNEFIVKRTGFWKSTIEITNLNGLKVLTTDYEKWYANSWVLNYKDHDYKLLVRNNPLAEWAILDGDTDVLAYGLTTGNGKAALKITGTSDTDYLFDFILWYLFVPIATENSGDNYFFIMQ